MAPLAILLDLDDTLVAFDAVTDVSWEQVCVDYARRPCQVPAGVLASIIKEHSGRYWSDRDRHRRGRADIRNARRSIVSAAFAALGLPVSDAIELADMYSEVRLANMYVLDGSYAILAQLRADGCRLGLLTNGDGPGQRQKIDRFALAEYFDTILVEGEIGFGKPDHRIYRRALSELHCAAHETRVVGDNLEWDVDAPQKMGIPSVWIDRKGRGLPPGSATMPWRTIRTIAELPRALTD